MRGTRLRCGKQKARMSGPFGGKKRMLGLEPTTFSLARALLDGFTAGLSVSLWLPSCGRRDELVEGF